MMQAILGALVALLGLFVSDQAHIYSLLLIVAGLGLIVTAPVMPSRCRGGNVFPHRLPKLTDSESYDGRGLLPVRNPVVERETPPKQTALPEDDEGFIQSVEHVVSEEESMAKAYRVERNPGEPDYKPIHLTWYEAALEVLAARRQYDAGDAIVVRLQKLNYKDARAKWQDIKRAYSVRHATESIAERAVADNVEAGKGRSA